jgi:hypothetical protein
LGLFELFWYYSLGTVLGLTLLLEQLDQLGAGQWEPSWVHRFLFLGIIGAAAAAAETSCKAMKRNQK